MIRRTLLLGPTLLLACTGRPSTDDATDTDPDTTVDTGPDSGDTGDPCHSNEVTIEPWFPRVWDIVEVDDHGTHSVYPFRVVDEENHPGWQTTGAYTFSSRWYGQGEGELGYWVYPEPTRDDAREEDKPEHVSSYTDVVVTQDGRHFTIRGGEWDFDCVRRVLPTDPRSPEEQQDLLCTDPKGVVTRWVAISWEIGDYVPPECLAQHDPPAMPTRWSAVYVTRGEETTVYPHIELLDDGWRGHEQDLVLRTDGTGEHAYEVTQHDSTEEWFTFPAREHTELTWQQLDGDHWRFDLVDGRSLQCTRDPDIGDWGDAIRTFALDCTDADGVRTWWVPMNMAWPWGWGSHATHGGWWTLPL